MSLLELLAHNSVLICTSSHISVVVATTHDIETLLPGSTVLKRQ